MWVTIKKQDRHTNIQYIQRVTIKDDDVTILKLT